MMEKRPLTPEEQWKAIADSAEEAEMAELEAQSPGDAEAELRSAGVDVAKLRRNGEAFADKLFASLDANGAPPGRAEAKPPTNVVPIRPRSRFSVWAVRLAVASVAVAAVAEAAVTIARWNRVPEIGPDTPMPPEKRRARELRREGFEACNAENWEQCVALLDEANGLDPAGDGAPAVQDARRQAAIGMVQRRPRVPEQVPSLDAGPHKAPPGH